MIGAPSETEKQIMETLNFAVKLNPEFIHLSLVTPFPGTALYDLGFEKGLFKEDFWKVFASKPDSSFIPKVWEENLTQENLTNLLNFGYKKFYLRPGYIFKQLFATNSFSAMKNQIIAGMKLLLSKSQ